MVSDICDVGIYYIAIIMYLLHCITKIHKIVLEAYWEKFMQENFLCP